MFNHYGLSASCLRHTVKAGAMHTILRNINLDLKKVHCALLGTSGPGKSLFLNILAGIERPASVEVYLATHRWKLVDFVINAYTQSVIDLSKTSILAESTQRI